MASAQNRTTASPRRRKGSGIGAKCGLDSIVEVTTATTALLISEVGLSEARYEVFSGAAALAYTTRHGLLEY
ncbi:MAG TPA: hypothetical protein VIW47_03860 [Nitrospiraceae bacterium]|jgi:outer membrane protein TolC